MRQRQDGNVFCKWILFLAGIDYPEVVQLQIVNDRAHRLTGNKSISFLRRMLSSVLSINMSLSGVYP